MLKGFVLGVGATALVLAGCAYWYFATGHAPVAASSAPMPLEKTFARMGLRSYLARLPHMKPQVPADEANLLAGARVYRDNCAVCHTLPTMDRGAIARGMFPPPPPLLQGKGVTDDEEWETYWKVENGIRMSGMPEFKDSLTETQIWQVTVLVKNADKLPPAVKSELAPTAAAPPTGPAGSTK
jgi:mono/diheme cytochrome c family protein